MAELPGWDRDRLATADPRDLQAARWLVYARARAPEIRVDYDSRIESLELAGKDGDAHRLHAAAIRRRDIGLLREGRESQKRLREVLELDLEDESGAVTA
jgi:hypothetical protein